MPFKNDFITTLTTRPVKPYKLSSVTTMYSQLRALNGKVDFENLDFLLEKDVVKPRLDAYAVSTRRTIVYVIRNIADSFGRNDILAVWKNEIKAIEEGEGALGKNEVAETQREIKMTWDDVMKIQADLNPRRIEGIVASLYTLFPPRRNLDYALMKIADEEQTDKNFNYLLIRSPEDMLFIFNRYKTDGVYHQQVFHVPEDLTALLHDYIVSQDRKVGDKLLDLSAEDITNTLHRVFGQVLRGEDKKIIHRGISTQVLRHLYINKYNDPKYADVISTMFGDASKMGHSVITQQEVYRQKK